MRTLKAGYLSLVKGTWINESLEKKRKDSLKALEKLAGVEIVDCGTLIQNELEAEEAFKKFSDAKVDVVIAHFITFSLGAIIPSFATRLKVPIVFWSEPEPEMKGGRIEANSFCATNMNAHALWKLGADYSLVYGHAKEALPELQRVLNVYGLAKGLVGARIGSAGGRVPGFYTSNFNELGLRKAFGVEVEGITLLELVKLAESSSGEELAAGIAAVKSGCSCEVSEEELKKSGALFAAMKRLTAKYRLDAWAVRCWPEFSDLYGIGVCHNLGCSTSQIVPTACEGDVYGALAMLAAKRLSGSDPFFCDMISFDEHGDTGVFWHCGAAPVSLCKKGCAPKMSKHSIIDGGGKKGVAVEFPLKPGPVTVMRIGENRDGSGFRLLAISGEGLETEQFIKGTPLKVRFKIPAMQLARTIVENGFEHHYVLCHGDIAQELKLFAKASGMEFMAL